MPTTKIAWTVEELSQESHARAFDCVVIGGGSAGLTTARTLAESGKRVAVLEAGPAPFLTHISNTELRFSEELTRDVRGQVQYSPLLPNGEPFGNNYGCLGGRGLFWNGASPRFRDHDFQGWPFGARELEPHFLWAEHEFRVTRKLGQTRLARKIIDALSARGFSAIPGPFAVDVGEAGIGQLGAGIASGLGAFFRAVGSAVASQQIKIACGVLGRRVLLSEGRARGVSASQGADGAQAEIIAKSVVLAGGGVESVRIAALSEVPDHSGRMGRGIQDHIFYRSFFEGPQIYDPVQPDAGAVYIPSTSQQGEQWEIHAPGRRLFSLDDGGGWSPGVDPLYRLMIRSFVATEKRDENRVESKDGPLGAATVHFSYTQRDEQQKQFVKERALEIGNALGIALVEERILGPGGSYHEAGGLDMGTDPGASVTDPDGRFHSVANLVCVDAATFPRIGATNPHLTIVAVARRKAERLASRL
jgi:choline dehydrogenase-like flavoprotein